LPVRGETAGSSTQPGDLNISAIVGLDEGQETENPRWDCNWGPWWNTVSPTGWPRDRYRSDS